MMKSLRMLASRSATLCCVTLLLGWAATAHAADITLVTSMPSGQSWNSAGTTPDYWFDDLAAHAGADYFVGVDRAGNPTTGLVVRTPMVADTFAGDSLNIGNGGSLAMKPGSRNVAYTISNLVMTNGAFLAHYSDNCTATLNGKITLSGTVRFNSASANVRIHDIKSQLVGSGLLLLQMDYATNDDEIWLGASNSTYSGTMEQTGGRVRLLSSTPFGQATRFTIQPSTNGKGTLDPEVDVNALNVDLVMSTSAVVKLDQTINFKSVTIDGTPLANGVYTAAALQASYAAYFTNDGGTLVVGPPVPQIQVTPGASPKVFNNINVMIQAGDKTSQNLTITNIGAASLNFLLQGAEPQRGLVLTGSPLFKIKSVTPATTAPLAPGASLVVVLEFGPATPADYTGTSSDNKTANLKIHTNSATQAVYNLDLQGATTVPVELSGFSAN